MIGKKITPDVLAEMIRQRKAGLKLSAIARRAGLDRGHVAYILTSHGVHDPQIRARELKRRKVCYLRRKGWSFQRIADRLGISVANAHYHHKHAARCATNRAAWHRRKQPTETAS